MAKSINKKKLIKVLTKDILKQSFKAMEAKIDRALNSGALDIESWDKDNAPMILPKIIVTAILKNESKQYEGKGTMYEKKVKKESENLIHFL